MLDESNKYEIELSKLNTIEQTTGVDMGFQKGMLDVKFGKLIVIKSPNDENYSSYDAGLEYALKERYKKFDSVTSDIIKSAKL